MPGLTIESNDWSVSASSPTQLSLPRNMPVTLSLSANAENTNPDLTTAADLRITLTPTDVDVDGSGEFTTELKMKRLFDIGYADGLSLIHI